MNTLDYISISQYLGTAFPTEIKTIDLYNSQYQLENPKKELPVNYPAVYIEFLTTNWADMTAGLKEGTSQIRIHVVLHSLKDTINIHKLSEPMRASVLAHYNLANQIAAKLEGFIPCTGLTPLSKSEEQNDSNHDQVIAELYTFSYTRLDTDSSELKDLIDKVIADFIVTGELVQLHTVH